MSFKIDDWEQAIIPGTATVLDAVKNLNDTGFRIALVVAETGRFIGTVTDGDIRRHLLHGNDLSGNVKNITNLGAIRVSTEVSKSAIEKMAKQRGIFEIPVVNSFGKLVGLNLLRHKFNQKFLKNKFVLMAGGLGTRMRPLTNDIPNPLVPINGVPMIQHIIEFARESGFRDFIVSVNYLGDKIKEFLKDGLWLGVKVSYVSEAVPLGTAGGLSLIKDATQDPMVICNADVLSKLDFRDLLDFHTESGAFATVAARVHEVQNPFGVLDIQQGRIVGVQEKPKHRSLVSAGIYVLSPEALKFIPFEKYLDIPEFLRSLISKNYSIVPYPIHEMWADVGTLDDLNRINELDNGE